MSVIFGLLLRPARPATTPDHRTVFASFADGLRRVLRREAGHARVRALEG